MVCHPAITVSWCPGEYSSLPWPHRMGSWSQSGIESMEFPLKLLNDGKVWAIWFCCGSH